MLNRTAQDWERLRALPALLKELPAITDELGFHFYSFSCTCPPTRFMRATFHWVENDLSRPHWTSGPIIANKRLFRPLDQGCLLE